MQDLLILKFDLLLIIRKKLPEQKVQLLFPIFYYIKLMKIKYNTVAFLIAVLISFVVSPSVGLIPSKHFAKFSLNI